MFLRTAKVSLRSCFLGAVLTCPAASQETPDDGGGPLLPPDIPPLLIPEPVLVPPILAEPQTFPDTPHQSPQASDRPMVRTAEMVERPPGDALTLDGSSYSEPADGAASAFGFDHSQGALSRPSVAGTQADRELQRMTARAERQANLEHYNVKIGPIPFRFGAGVEFQFTDNANLTTDNKTADLSILPHLDIYGGLRLSRQNVLSIQLGIGYLWNLNRPELDRALTNASVGLDSDSGISFDLKLGNFRINLHERPAIPRQQFDLITQRNPLQYSQFTNVAGVTVFWDMNSRTTASLQYDHVNVVSLKSEVENLDQSSDLFGASTTYRFSEALSLGIQANASYIKYKRRFLNESANYDAGVTLTAQLGRNTMLRIVGGYQLGEFGSGGEIGDSSDTSNWHLRVSINNSLNKYVSQSLSFGHETQVGTASNSAVVDYIRHQMNFSFSRTFGLSTSASFDSASESGGIFAQDFKLYQFGIYGYWTMSKYLSLNMSYRFIKRDSSSDDEDMEGSLDYIENRLDLGVRLNL
jgi:hypothetical protein